MKKIFIVLTLVWFGLISNSYASNFQRGLEAYSKGDYIAAHRVWYTLAAEGDARAQFWLGVMYDDGVGVEKDDQEALYWYNSSAEEGYHKAQNAMGLMYVKGKNVLQDYKEAARLFRLSSAQGNALGQYNLGLMYFNGMYVPQDFKEAEKLFRLSASQGSSFGQYGLGLIYVNGYGVIEDKVLAHMWFNISSSKGHKEAKKERDYIIKEMPASQIEKAQDLARQCVSNNYKGC